MLHVTVNVQGTYLVDTVTSCEPFTWIDGITYYNSTNTPHLAYIDISGCDSVIMLNLTVNSPDTNVTNNDPTLIANQQGAVYQWLDCDDNYNILPGETGQSYVPQTNGNYAVQLTINGCIDTSACYSIETANIFEPQSSHNIYFYPNPGNGNLTIQSNSTFKNLAIKIFSVNQQLIYLKQNVNQLPLQINLDVSSGIYFMEIDSEYGSKLHKLIVE